MKTFLTATLMTFLLSSAFAEENHHSKSHAKEKNGHLRSSLTLNQGKKWLVDQIMKENMDAIHQQFKTFNELSKAKKSSTKDASELSAVISASAQNIISKCKMEPKQDEAFHIILADLLTAAADLKKAERIEPALNQLTQALKSYSDYFDHPLSI